MAAFSTGTNVTSKIRGKFQVTYEALVQILLPIDPRLSLIMIDSDPLREIVSFIFTSNEPVESETGVTMEISEGQECPAFSVDIGLIIEHMRKTVENYDKLHSTNENNVQYLRELTRND